MQRLSLSLWCIVSIAVMVSNRKEIEGPDEASSSGSTPISQQEEAMRGLIIRLLPDHQDLFRVHAIGHCSHDHPAAPRFEVHVSGGVVHIRGTSGNVHNGNLPVACARSLCADRSTHASCI